MRTNGPFSLRFHRRILSLEVLVCGTGWFSRSLAYQYGDAIVVRKETWAHAPQTKLFSIGAVELLAQIQKNGDVFEKPSPGKGPPRVYEG